MHNVSYLLSFTQGFVTFISPCILPLLPVYLVYLAGVSGEEAKDSSLKKTRLIINSIGFVIGFTIIFVMLGATATFLGSFLKSNIDIFRKISGIVMVVFGLNFMGLLKLKFLNFEKRIDFKFKELKFLNSIVFGIVFGFAWSPCQAATLGNVLLMAGNTDTVLHGILLLLVFSAGLGIPFILASIAFDRFRGIFKQIQKHNRIISIISGIVLILAGVLVFTDNLKYIGALFL